MGAPPAWNDAHICEPFPWQNWPSEAAGPTEEAVARLDLGNTYSRASANLVVGAADLVCFVGTSAGGMTTHFFQVPPEGTKSQRAGNRMALDNIRQRLAGSFNNMARLTVSEVDGDYQVRMVFPHPWRL